MKMFSMLPQPTFTEVTHITHGCVSTGSACAPRSFGSTNLRLCHEARRGSMLSGHRERSGTT